MKFAKINNKKFLFVVYSLIFLIACNARNELNLSDYEIIEKVIEKEIILYGYDLQDDKALKYFKRNTPEYEKKIKELYLNQNYESDYYFSLDKTLFVYKDNWYVQELFAKNNFSGSTKNLIPLKIDFSKIKTKKHLIIIDKNSKLARSQNYIGDFKLSRIIYDGDKAVILMENNGRLLIFLEKKNNEWSVYKEAGIPYEIYEKKIDL